MTRLFVAGYPREATKEDLLPLFRQFGATAEGIVFPRDRRTRRKKGYAYVEVTDAAAADAAVAPLHDLEVAGDRLTVTRAEDRPPKIPRRRR